MVLATAEAVRATVVAPRTVTVLTGLSAAPFAILALLRAFGLERGWPLVPVMAFVPYAAGLALFPLIAALAARRWVVVAVAAVAFLTLAGCVVPRALGHADPVARAAGGPDLRVLTSNMKGGAADPAQLVSLIREHSVDLLALEEYTPQGQAALGDAGLDELLPYRVAYPSNVPGGSALYSRYPLTDSGYRWLPPYFGQAYATVQVPGAPEILVEAVHPAAPSAAGMLADWRTGLDAQPRATPRGPVRLLLGDFNATLDHSPLRRLLGSGYRDAASVVGAGFQPTWPYDGTMLPGVTIDHVLADPRMAVRAVSTYKIRRTDHRAVLAHLILPLGLN
jgi:endonuclease/exonuclease/phosphatase (EEP) superfamily protein YafD